MKKFFLITGLLILTTNIFGQKPETKYGLKAGINYSKYTPDFEINGYKFEEYGGRMGFFVGGFVNIGFTSILKLQPELLFALQGTSTSREIEVRFTADEEPFIAEIKTRISEFTILLPIMLQLYPSTDFYIETGPQFGFIMGRKEKLIDDQFKEIGSLFQPSDDCPNCEKFDFGVSLGIGYNFTNQFGLNARYYTGLIERNNSIKSSVINLGVNYKL